MLCYVMLCDHMVCDAVITLVWHSIRLHSGDMDVTDSCTQDLEDQEC